MPLPSRPSTFVHNMLHSLIFKRLPGVLLGLAIGFGVVMTAQAAETEACGFGLFQCDEQGVVWDFAAVGADNVAQLARNDGLAETIIMVGYFLANQILPLLIFIGFFIFLYYLARVFIIDAANTDSRDEAKKRAIWGLAAFILIASLWGIVNLLTVPQIDRERSLCPDYLEGFCGNLGQDRTGPTYDGDSDIDFGNPSGGNSGGSGGNNGGTGGGIGTVGGNNDAPPLAELLYGTYQDTASFNFRTGAPRASTSAVTIGPTASCVAGLTTLQTAAGIETLQSGYLLYKNPDATTGWLNITDGTEQTEMVFDAEWMRDEIVNSTDLALVHTHPQATIAELGLSSSGHPPSVSDLEIMCDDVVNDAQFITVDQNNVWVAESTGNTCPRRAAARESLPVVSTLLHLAMITPAQRNTAFEEIYTWDDLPFSMRSDLNQYDETDFNALSVTEIVTLADDAARSGNIRITRYTPNDFCATF